LEQGKAHQVAIIRQPNFMPLDLPQEVRDTLTRVTKATACPFP